MSELSSFLRTLLLIIVALPATMAHADIDLKYYQKAASKVWGMDLPQFNPDAELTDSIFQRQSAVFIARYNGLTANYNGEINPSKFGVSSGSMSEYIAHPTVVFKSTEFNRSNATEAVKIQRSMVKINDTNAAEYFTEFSVDPFTIHESKNFVYYSIKPAFGARIIKPDGTVNIVDMSQALTVTLGKDNKDAEYKVAIPGLQPGDILDYFYYTEYWCDEFSMPDFRIYLLAIYPTRDLIVDIRVADRLALEYGAYNGAPKIMPEKMNEETNRLFFEIQDMEALDSNAPFFAAGRQMPYIDIHILNNLTNFGFIPDYARVGGARHITREMLMMDVASAINRTKYPSQLVNEAVSTAKSWIKSHPDASVPQITDAAWLALRYAILKSGEKITDHQWAVMFYFVMEKLNVQVETRVGVTSSRQHPSVGDLVKYDDAVYMNKSGNRFYIMSGSLLDTPGTIPPYYDREAYILFNGSPTIKHLENWAVDGQLPPVKAADNEMKVTTEISIDPDDPERLTAKTVSSYSGLSKYRVENLVSPFDCMTAIVRFLGRKPDAAFEKLDREPVDKAIRKYADAYADAIWSSDDTKLNATKVLSPGCTPDSAVTVIEFEGTVGDAITEAGNDIVINIGRFIGKQRQFKDSQRQRDISVILEGPAKNENTITFKVPEGYEVVESSLDDLRKSVITQEASFTTTVENGGNVITINTAERYPRSVYAASSWSNLLSIMDATADFTKASLLLRKKESK